MATNTFNNLFGNILGKNVQPQIGRTDPNQQNQYWMTGGINPYANQQMAQQQAYQRQLAQQQAQQRAYQQQMAQRQAQSGNSGGLLGNILGNVLGGGSVTGALMKGLGKALGGGGGSNSAANYAGGGQSNMMGMTPGNFFNFANAAYMNETAAKNRETSMKNAQEAQQGRLDKANAAGNAMNKNASYYQNMTDADKAKTSMAASALRDAMMGNGSPYQYQKSFDLANEAMLRSAINGGQGGDSDYINSKLKPGEDISKMNYQQLMDLMMRNPQQTYADKMANQNQAEWDADKARQQAAQQAQTSAADRSRNDFAQNWLGGDYANKSIDGKKVTDMSYQELMNAMMANKKAL